MMEAEQFLQQMREFFRKQYPSINCPGWFKRSVEREYITDFLSQFEHHIRSAEKDKE